MPTSTNLMTSEEVAEYLRVDPRTLANWRSKRQGPRSIRIGASTVRYLVSDLEDYLKSLNPDLSPDVDLGLVA